jgi:hypothetical protein
MRGTLAVFILACHSPAPPRPPAPHATAEAGEAAYNAKDYARCEAIYDEVAASGAASDLYNAACCAALAGHADHAFALLDRAVAAGLHDAMRMASDDDLAPVRRDPRWSSMLARVTRAADDYERSLGDPALHKELLALVAEDQAARMAMVHGDPNDPALQQATSAIDARTTARMKQVVAAHGWPGKTMVGEDGAHAAWLLVQHADADIAFQKQVLALLEPLVATTEVTAIDYAYLYDRVAVAEHRPQRWGTQYGQNGKPAPIEDEAHVDARRKAIGLGTMAEYDQQMRAMYGDQLGH